METEYRIGDLVKIINYGGKYWVYKDAGLPKPTNIISEDDDIWVGDTRPELVGQTGIITKITIPLCAIKTTTNHMSWFHLNDQIQLLNQNPNTPDSFTDNSKGLIPEIQQMIRDLRDGPYHICPADEHGTMECSCSEYDAIIDKLEELL